TWARQPRARAGRVPATAARTASRAAYGRRHVDRRRSGAHGPSAHATRTEGPGDDAGVWARPVRSEHRTWPAGEARMSMQGRGVAVPRETTTLADLLD